MISASSGLKLTQSISGWETIVIGFFFFHRTTVIASETISSTLFTQPFWTKAANDHALFQDYITHGISCYNQGLWEAAYLYLSRAAEYAKRDTVAIYNLEHSVYLCLAEEKCGAISSENLLICLMGHDPETAFDVKYPQPRQDKVTANAFRPFQNMTKHPFQSLFINANLSIKKYIIDLLEQEKKLKQLDLKRHLVREDHLKLAKSFEKKGEHLLAALCHTNIILYDLQKPLLDNSKKLSKLNSYFQRSLALQQAEKEEVDKGFDKVTTIWISIAQRTQDKIIYQLEKKLESEPPCLLNHILLLQYLFGYVAWYHYEGNNAEMVAYTNKALDALTNVLAFINNTQGALQEYKRYTQRTEKFGYKDFLSTETWNELKAIATIPIATVRTTQSNQDSKKTPKPKSVVTSESSKEEDTTLTPTDIKSDNQTFAPSTEITTKNRPNRFVTTPRPKKTATKIATPVATAAPTPFWVTTKPTSAPTHKPKPSTALDIKKIPAASTKNTWKQQQEAIKARKDAVLIEKYQREQDAKKKQIEKQLEKQLEEINQIRQAIQLAQQPKSVTETKQTKQTKLSNAPQALFTNPPTAAQHATKKLEPTIVIQKLSPGLKNLGKFLCDLEKKTGEPFYLLGGAMRHIILKEHDNANDSKKPLLDIDIATSASWDTVHTALTDHPFAEHNTLFTDKAYPEDKFSRIEYRHSDLPGIGKEWVVRHNPTLKTQGLIYDGNQRDTTVSAVYGQFFIDSSGEVAIKIFNPTPHINPSQDGYANILEKPMKFSFIGNSHEEIRQKIIKNPIHIIRLIYQAAKNDGIIPDYDSKLIKEVFAEEPELFANVMPQFEYWMKNKIEKLTENQYVFCVNELSHLGIAKTLPDVIAKKYSLAAPEKAPPKPLKFG